MKRKAMIALFAMASAAVFAPGAASARGGFHGGGFHGGFHGGGFRAAGIGGGWHGGGWHGGYYRRGFPFVAAAVGAGLGYGLYGYNYGYYGPVGYYDGYGYGGCYVVRQRVLTPYGWRIRPVEVCD